MRCHECGAELPDGAQTCPNCGAPQNQNNMNAPYPQPGVQYPQGAMPYQQPGAQYQPGGAPYPNMHQAPAKDSSSILLLVWVIAEFVIYLVSRLITKFDGFGYSGGLSKIYVIVQIISEMLPILPAIAIKDKTLKIVGIVLSAILVILFTVGNIRRFIF